MNDSTAKQDLARAMDQFTHAMQKIAKALRPIITAARRFARRLHATMWRAYHAAGYPHGETEEGLLRWVRAQSAEQQVRARAEREASIAETVPLLRPAAPI